MKKGGGWAQRETKQNYRIYITFIYVFSCIILQSPACLFCCDLFHSNGKRRYETNSVCSHVDDVVRRKCERQAISLARVEIRIVFSKLTFGPRKGINDIVRSRIRLVLHAHVINRSVLFFWLSPLLIERFALRCWGIMRNITREFEDKRATWNGHRKLQLPTREIRIRGTGSPMLITIIAGSRWKMYSLHESPYRRAEKSALVSRRSEKLFDLTWRFSLLDSTIAATRNVTVSFR